MADFHVPSTIQAQQTNLPLTAASWYPITGSSNVNLAGMHVAGYHTIPSANSGFAKSITIRLRKQQGANSPVVAVGLYDIDASGKPNNRLAYSATQTIGNSSDNGQYYTFTLTQGLTDSIAPALVSGSKFAIVVHCLSGEVRVARLSGSSTTIWSKRQDSALMVSPFGAATTSTMNPFTAWMTCEQSTAPSATIVQPLTAAGVAPTFIGNFTDAETNDRMLRYEIEVRVQNTTTLLDRVSRESSAVERSANQFNHVWSGTPLTTGQTHEWRARVQDRTGQWSAWAPSTGNGWQPISISAPGVVDIANGAPYAKLETWPPQYFTGQWSHTSGYAMTAIQIRITSTSGSGEVVLSPQVSIAPVATNGTFSVATSLLSLGTLRPGFYQWEARGRSATTNEWSAYSQPRTFSINAAPNQAVTLEPQTGSSWGIRPTLRWRVTDPDPDDITGIDVAAQLELTNPSGTVIVKDDLIYTTTDPLTGEMAYDLTDVDLPNGATGQYAWRVRGKDISANAFGAWSNQATFRFAPAPSVTIIAPAENAIVQTSTPSVQFTVSLDASVAYQVTIYRQGISERPIYTTGRITYSGNERTITIPAGYLQPTLSYDLYVTAWGSTGLSNTTPKRTFTIAYPSADALGGVTVSLLAKRRDYEASTPIITWVNGNVNDFVGIVIRRTDSLTDETIPVALITNQMVTAWRDHAAPTNRDIQYQVSRLVRVGSDIRESPRETINLTIPMAVPTLTSLYDGDNTHASVMWLSDGYSGAFERPSATYVTWGGMGAPTVISTPASYGKHTISLTVTIRTDARGSMDEHYDDFMALVESGDPLVFRGEDRRIFCRIVSFSWQRGSVAGTRVLTLALEEISWDEMVSIPI